MPAGWMASTPTATVKESRRGGCRMPWRRTRSERCHGWREGWVARMHEVDGRAQASLRSTCLGYLLTGGDYNPSLGPISG
jgi:hypothetical protein